MKLCSFKDQTTSMTLKLHDVFGRDSELVQNQSIFSCHFSPSLKYNLFDLDHSKVLEKEIMYESK